VFDEDIGPTLQGVTQFAIGAKAIGRAMDNNDSYIIRNIGGWE